MSFSFFLTAYAPPSLADLLAAVDDHGDLRMAEEISDPWPPGFAFHLHREGVSTRGVELCWEPDRFQVRLLTLSSREDWELAFRVLEFAGPNATIEGENGHEAKVADLRAEFADLCELTNEGGAAFLVQRITDEGASLTLPGPVRAFCIGPRLLAELQAGPEDTFSERVLEKIREVQYTSETEDYYCASVLQATIDEDTRFTLTAFGPGVSYLVPEVGFIALVGDDDQELFLDYDSFLELLGDWCRYLDERQVFVDALSGRHWEAFVAAARACRVEPTSFLKGEVAREALRETVVEAAAGLATTLRQPRPSQPRQREAIADLDRAIELLHAARERRPEESEILNDLGQALAQRAALRAAREEHDAALLDHDRALRFLAKAARRDRRLRPELALAWARRSDLSIASGARRDALADLERANTILESCLEEGTREILLNVVALRCREAELAVQLDDRDRAADALAQAEALCSQRDEPEAWARLLRVRGRLRRSDDPAAAVLDFERGCAKALEAGLRNADELGTYFEVVEDLWEELIRQLDVEGAKDAAATARGHLDVAVKAGVAQAGWISRVFSAQATFLGASRRYAEALTTAREGLALTLESSRVGDQVWVARSYNALASALEDAGDLEASADAYSNALAAYSLTTESQSEPVRTRVLRASILLDAGQPSAARAELTRARARLPEGAPGEDLAADWLRAGVLHQEARVARLLGELEAARQAVTEAELLLARLCSDDDDPYAQGYLAVVRVEIGEIAAAEGNAAEAKRSTQAGLELLRRHAAAGLHFGLQSICDGERLLADLERRDANPEAALSRLEAILKHVGDDNVGLRYARLQRERALALADLDRVEEARAAAAAACARAAGSTHLAELLESLTAALYCPGPPAREVADLLEALPAQLALGANKLVVRRAPDLVQALDSRTDLDLSKLRATLAELIG